MAFANFGKKIGNAAQASVEKTKAVAETAKLNNANSKLVDEIKGIYAELGEYVVTNQLLHDDTAAKKLIDSVAAIQVNLGNNNKQIMVLKGQITCSSCGAAVSLESKFCPGCGAAVEQPVIDRQEETGAAGQDMKEV